MSSVSDPREKGFKQGIFDTNDPRSFFSLSRLCENFDEEKEDYLIEMSCEVMNLLSKYTDFFEEKGKDLKNEDYVKNESILFSTALFTRILYLLPHNIDWVIHYSYKIFACTQV